MNNAKMLQVINQNQRFVLLTHVNPDLDGVASQLALAEFLRSRGKRVSIIQDKPLSPRFSFLRTPKMIIAQSQRKLSYDVAIVVDCADLSRMGAAVNVLQEGKPLINIDHHRTGHPFGTINYVDSTASSTAEALFTLFAGWKIALTKKIAYFLYLGILSDTGSFRFANTTARTHQIAAALLAKGISPAQAYRQVYEDLPPPQMFTLSALMARTQFALDQRVAYLDLLPKHLRASSQEYDLKEKIFSLLRMIRTLEVIVIFTPETSKRIRVNLRSVAKVDVAIVAEQFHGGGHRGASGCVVADNLSSTRRRILSAIGKELAR